MKAEPMRPEEPTMATVLMWLESGGEDMVDVLGEMLGRFSSVELWVEGHGAGEGQESSVICYEYLGRVARHL